MKQGLLREPEFTGEEALIADAFHQFINAAYVAATDGKVDPNPPAAMLAWEDPDPLDFFAADDGPIQTHRWLALAADKGQERRIPVNGPGAIWVERFDEGGSAKRRSFWVCRINDLVAYEVGTGRVVDDEVSSQQYRVAASALDGVVRIRAVAYVFGEEGVVGCAG